MEQRKKIYDCHDLRNVLPMAKWLEIEFDQLAFSIAIVYDSITRKWMMLAPIENDGDGNEFECYSYFQKVSENPPELHKMEERLTNYIEKNVETFKRCLMAHFTSFVAKWKKQKEVEKHINDFPPSFTGNDGRGGSVDVDDDDDDDSFYVRGGITVTTTNLGDVSSHNVAQVANHIENLLNNSIEIVGTSRYTIWITKTIIWSSKR